MSVPGTVARHENPPCHFAFTVMVTSRRRPNDLCAFIPVGAGRDDVTVVDGYRLHAWGEEPRWEAIEVPDPGPGEVLVEVEACGIGLTVLNCMNGDLDDSPEVLPLTPGHEVVGRVAATGEGVVSSRVGDRVMAYFYLSCFRCRWCLSGNESRCDRRAGWYGVHRDGGYAPLTIMPAGNAVPLEGDLSASEATVIPDAVATSVHVCRRRLGLGTGDLVAVIGAAGGVGAHMIQVAAACGARVAGLERTDEKLGLVSRLGAIPVDSSDLSAELDEFDGAADAIVDLVGTRQSLTWSMEHLRAGGRLVVLTTFRGRTFEVDPRALVFHESSIVGSRYASRSELIEASALVSSGRVKAVIGETVGPSEVDAVHGALRAGELLGRGALVWRGER
jgi:D-arabinose 1-dehydrogenase-like Zn-dependent alcohol dehydrogenase